MNTLTFHIERDLGPFDQREYALDVTYQVNRYYPATMEQPEEGGDVDIVSVLLDGEEFDLTQREEDRLYNYCMDDAAEKSESAAEQRAEMRSDDELLQMLAGERWA